MLHGLEEGERPLLGRRVAVYGGGNTAVDAARTARRLGASDAVVVYRRTRDRMPAHAEEVADAEEEGVVFHWLSTIDRVDPGGLIVEQMELDENGFPQPTGRTERLAADSVVLALGQDTDLSFLGDASALQVSGRHDRHGPARSPRPAPACSPAATWSRGSAPSRSPSATVAAPPRASTTGWPGAPPAPVAAVDLAPYEALNTWYFEDADRSPPTSASSWPGAARPSTRSCTGSTATRRSTKPGAACPAGAASPATTASRCARTTR